MRLLNNLLKLFSQNNYRAENIWVYNECLVSTSLIASCREALCRVWQQPQTRPTGKGRCLLGLCRQKYAEQRCSDSGSFHRSLPLPLCSPNICNNRTIRSSHKSVIALGTMMEFTMNTSNKKLGDTVKFPIQRHNKTADSINVTKWPILKRNKKT